MPIGKRSSWPCERCHHRARSRSTVATTPEHRAASTVRPRRRSPPAIAGVRRRAPATTPGRLVRRRGGRHLELEHRLVDVGSVDHKRGGPQPARRVPDLAAPVGRDVGCPAGAAGDPHHADAEPSGATSSSARALPGRRRARVVTDHEQICGHVAGATSVAGVGCGDLEQRHARARCRRESTPRRRSRRTAIRRACVGQPLHPLEAAPWRDRADDHEIGGSVQARRLARRSTVSDAVDGRRSRRRSPVPHR